VEKFYLTKSEFDPEFPLEYGAYLIAKSNSRKVNYEEITSQLDELAQYYSSLIAVRNHSQPFELLLDLKETMEHYQFKGNTEDYYRAKNSYINFVLSEKVGIPISLSLICHAIARRAGIQLQLIGFPTHVLLKIVSPFTTLFFDAFNMTVITREDCVNLLRVNAPQLPFSEYFLNQMDRKSMFVRMCNNLTGIYTRQHKYEKLVAVAKQLVVIKGIEEAKRSGDYNVLGEFLVICHREDELELLRNGEVV